MQYFGCYGVKYLKQVILLMTLAEVALTVCPEKSGVKLFGNNCHLRCRCKDNSQCDFNSGACANGCASGWIGPGCQYENLAYNKTCVQSSTYAGSTGPFQTGNAIDGILDTCSSTQTSVNNWWRLDMGKQHTVVGLTVHLQKNESPSMYRNDIIVYVINNTNGSAEHPVCHRETGSRSHNDVILDLTCYTPLIGQYVEIVVKERSRLQLCEVEVYGGRELGFMKSTNQSSTFLPELNSNTAVDGMSADNATYRCAQTRRSRDPWWATNLGQQYTIQSVVIYNRDEAGKQDLLNGFRLELDHSSGFDSPELYVYTHSGSTRQKIIRIDLTLPVTGQHVRVIVPGDNKILMLCEVEIFGNCLDGSCGYDCQLKCLCNTTTTGHRKINNTCPYGCLGRATGLSDRCDHNCSKGRWGYRCIERCGMCANNQSCDVINGTCPTGCQIGFKQTPRCSEGCETGLFGANCEQRCGHCADKASCYGMFGTCQNACEPGYKFPLCTKVCNPYSWGVNCNTTCGKCRNEAPCDPVTGNCLGGCGFRIQETPLCEKGCEAGFYGPLCKRCGRCDGICDSTTGSCRQCHPGYQLPLCQKACLPGQFGTNCGYTCGHCKDGVACNAETGDCPDGCKKEWAGSLCNIGTELRSLFGPPGEEHGTVAVVGLVLGGIGAFVCTTVMLVGLAIFCLRRKKKREEENLKYKSYMVRNQLGVTNQYDCDQTTF